MNEALAILVLLSIPSDPEEEEAKRDAGKHLARGNALFDSKKYEQALEAFRDAYDTYPSAKIHYNLARTQAALGRPIEALEHFDRFVENSGLPPDDKRRKIAEVERSELEAKVGRIAFVTEVLGTSLTLDGAPACPLPKEPLRVLPGKHNVEIDTGDGRSFRESVAVAASETVRIHVVFSMPVPPPPPPRGELVEAPPPISGDSPPITSEWWFWTVIGAGAVAIAAGVAIGVAARPDEFRAEGELDVTSTAQWEKL